MNLNTRNTKFPGVFFGYLVTPVNNTHKTLYSSMDYSQSRYNMSKNMLKIISQSQHYEGQDNINNLDVEPPKKQNFINPVVQHL